MLAGYTLEGLDSSESGIITMVLQHIIGGGRTGRTLSLFDFDRLACDPLWLAPSGVDIGVVGKGLPSKRALGILSLSGARHSPRGSS